MPEGKLEVDYVHWMLEFQNVKCLCMLANYMAANKSTSIKLSAIQC